MAMMKWRETNRANWIGVRPAHDGTQIIKSAYTDNTPAIVHTVTAGKTFYLDAWSIFGSTGGGAANIQLYVRNASDVYQYDLFSGSPNATTHVAAGLSYFQPIEIPEGWDIVAVCGAATARINATIKGREE